MKNKNWKVVIEGSAKKELKELLISGALGQSDIEVLKKWVSEVEVYGPDTIRDSSFWYDHALHSEWKGYRSSSFSFKGRIIYKVIDEKIIVQVVRITTDHNYRR